MTEMEFENEKTKFTNFCIEYEKFQKTKYLIDSLYFKKYGKLIIEQLRLSILLDKYNNAVSMKNRGDSTEDIKKVFEVIFKEVQKEYDKTCLKYNNLLKTFPINEKLNESIINKIEELYEDLCVNYHPAIYMNNSNKLQGSWRFLTYFYQNNNYEGMKSVVDSLHMNKCEINKEILPLYVNYYNDFINTKQNEINEDVNNYPFNAKEIIEDELLEAKRVSEYRQKNSELLEQVVKVKKEFQSLFDENFIE